MNLGLFDLPAPLLDAIDRVLSLCHLPALVRVVVYAIAAGWIGMVVYRRCSDQGRLAALRDAIRSSQRSLTAHEGSYAELQGLIRSNLRLALLQLGLTLRPALIASLPLLFVLPWLSNRFDLAQPTDKLPFAVCAKPTQKASELAWQPAAAAIASAPGCWQLMWPEAVGAVAGDAKNPRMFSVPADARSPGVGKFIAFNWLIGNPAGYLPANASIDEVSFGFEPLDLLASEPAWLRRWPFWFFVPLLAVSLGIKWRWRLR